MTPAPQPIRANDSALAEYGADRATLRDAQAEIEGVNNDLEKLIRRMEAAAVDHGYVREQCREAAEQLKAAQHDEIRVAAWILDCALSR
ncbi:MAG: hypothetical protein Dbin4_02793 [Alphaproteobacteria bacterium]|nr:hypothetical protein [Alphaproteobacteria bacterium]